MKQSWFEFGLVVGNRVKQRIIKRKRSEEKAQWNQMVRNRMEIRPGQAVLLSLFLFSCCILLLKYIA